MGFSSKVQTRREIKGGGKWVREIQGAIFQLGIKK